MALRSAVQEREPSFVSTGHLPGPETVQSLMHEAQRRFQSNRDGENSQAYPALARVPSELFGVCVVGTSSGLSRFTGRKLPLNEEVCPSVTGTSPAPSSIASTAAVAAAIAAGAGDNRRRTS